MFWIAALVYLALLSTALTVIDVRWRRLPHALVLPSYPILAALLVADTVGSTPGSVGVSGIVDAAPLQRAALTAGACALLYLALFVLGRGALGFGDVTLAGVLGLPLGYSGPASAVVGALTPFLIGGVAGLAVLIREGRQARAVRSAGLSTPSGHTARIPFGPCLLAGAWIGLIIDS